MVNSGIDLACVYATKSRNLTALVSSNNAMTNADPEGKRLAIPRSLLWRGLLVAVCSCAADQEKSKSEDQGTPAT
jgi:hypothetical protein